MTIKIMPFSPTLASVAMLLLRKSSLQFGNWLSYRISIKGSTSQMSPLYLQLCTGIEEVLSQHWQNYNEDQETAYSLVLENQE